MRTKYLYIRLTVREGEREHTHHCLHTTRAENINFAAELYAARFWGTSYRDDSTWYAWGGEIAITLEKVQEISAEKYNELHELFY
jgi:hypothetical protein